ncbi:Ctr copper transporter family-domain-containing protein [Mariannaea sp. PMI_226]|nr:Ctr copper transporter family-domain-containing protein [Mariannaea sp. PMI_226]
MDMSDMSSTATLAMTATHTMDMASTSTAKSGGMSMGGGCKISMLWNWYTVDSCFISKSWHITSKGMFAGSCIGVILLVMSLEFLRRSVKEFDAYLIRQHEAKLQRFSAIAANSSNEAGSSGSKNGNVAACAAPLTPFRPNIFQQAIRAFLHMVQFAVAYFVMLLAMYYNGYIIICIFIGAFLGAFVFQWETLSAGRGTSAAHEATVCCG